MIIRHPLWQINNVFGTDLQGFAANGVENGEEP
jgi:hypothetical protein